MRDLFIKNFETLLNILVVIIAAIVVVISLYTMGNLNFFVGLLYLVMGLIYLVFVTGAIYMVLGIHHNTKKTNQLLEQLIEKTALPHSADLGLPQSSFIPSTLDSAPRDLSEPDTL